MLKRVESIRFFPFFYVHLLKFIQGSGGIGRRYTQIREVRLTNPYRVGSKPTSLTNLKTKRYEKVNTEVQRQQVDTIKDR